MVAVESQQAVGRARRHTCPLLRTCLSESNSTEHPAWQEQIHGLELEQKLAVQAVEEPVELLVLVVLRAGCPMAER